jgi:hypothetical protein
MPDRLSADSPLATTVNQIIDYLRSLTPRNAATASVSHTPNGVFISTAPPAPAGKSGWRFAKPIKYDHTKSYAFQEIVYVAADDAMVTAGTVDPDTGQTVFAFAGKYVALQAVSPVVNPTGLTAGTYYHIPQLPLPTPGDPDNAAPDSTAYGTGEAQNYWDIVTQDVQCY